MESRGNRLYDVEDTNKVKIHYIGYNSTHDEWIDRIDLVHRAPAPVEEVELSLLTVLATTIKQRLACFRKDDPSVKIYLPFDSTSFVELAAKGKSLGKIQGNEHYTIRNYKCFNELLGEQWYLRITNSHGDFSYVILETIRFHLFRPKPLLDFNVVQKEGSLHFEHVYIQQSCSLCFSFVRGDGNRHKLQAFL